MKQIAKLFKLMINPLSGFIINFLTIDNKYKSILFNHNTLTFVT